MNKNQRKYLLLIVGVILIIVLTTLLYIKLKPKEAELLTGKYELITSLKYATMTNDGGSYTDIKYEIDFDTHKVTKYETKYKGMEGFLYQNEISNIKNLNEYEVTTLSNIFKELINNPEKYNIDDVYKCYTLVLPDKKEITFYNLDVFKKIDKIVEDEGINMKVTINDKKYDVTFENNETVEELIKHLPLTISMNELNGNEKYYYTNFVLPTNSKNVKQINKGDIMLYNDNCIVIFYKSFNTTYDYTYLGHIDNMEDLDSSNVSVTFEK